MVMLVMGIVTVVKKKTTRQKSFFFVGSSATIGTHVSQIYQDGYNAKMC